MSGWLIIIAARTDKLPDDVIERIRTRRDLSTIPARYARARASSSMCSRTNRSRRIFKIR